MNQEAKDRFGLSRLEPGEKFLGNFPIERYLPQGRLDTSGVNFIAQEKLNSGDYQSVRMDQALDENGNVIIGERAIFANPKENT